MAYPELPNLGLLISKSAPFLPTNIELSIDWFPKAARMFVRHHFPLKIAFILLSLIFFQDLLSLVSIQLAHLKLCQILAPFYFSQLTATLRLQTCHSHWLASFFGLRLLAGPAGFEFLGLFLGAFIPYQQVNFPMHLLRPQHESLRFWGRFDERMASWDGGRRRIGRWLICFRVGF